MSKYNSISSDDSGEVDVVSCERCGAFAPLGVPIKHMGRCNKVITTDKTFFTHRFLKEHSNKIKEGIDVVAYCEDLMYEGGRLSPLEERLYISLLNYMDMTTELELKVDEFEFHLRKIENTFDQFKSAWGLGEG